MIAEPLVQATHRHQPQPDPSLGDRSDRRAAPRSERGQVAVVVACFLVVLIGAAGLAVDVGSWYRADRATQAAADAAALAGAQGLQDGTDPAAAL
ncbi:MAG TPA: pilus assembly protein TadG-related protein, partial [Gaiellaceae bacterium]|nr:pilus assembly protein TadG-related protein [Gaiellaceae bacterium]